MILLYALWDALVQPVWWQELWLETFDGETVIGSVVYVALELIAIAAVIAVVF